MMAFAVYVVAPGVSGAGRAASGTCFLTVGFGHVLHFVIVRLKT